MNDSDQRQASGSVTYADPLTEFLYELMRDHVPPGVVEELVRTAEHSGPELEEILYTNGWLAAYAKHLAHRLRPL